MKQSFSFLILTLTALSCNSPDNKVTPPAAQPSYAQHARPVFEVNRPTSSPTDARTPTQIAQAACTGPNGVWQCPNVKKAPTIKLGSGAVIPPAWTVPNWYFDPQNVSGTASDGNNCTTSSTACITFQQIYTYRWGGDNAQLQQQTAVTELSSEAGFQDTFRLSMNPGSRELDFYGTLTQVTTATVGTFTARNRAAGTTNTITASGQSGAYWTTYVGDLVHDTTAGAYFWVDADLGSATAQITEPMALYTPITGSFPPAYVTIANSDALTVNTESSINLSTSLLGSITFTQLTMHRDVVGYSSASNLSFYQCGGTTTTYYENIYGFSFFYNSRMTPLFTGGGAAYGGSFVEDSPVLGDITIGSTSIAAPFRLDGDILLDPTISGDVQTTGATWMARVGLLGILQSNGGAGLAGGIIDHVSSEYGAGNALWGPGQLQANAGVLYAFSSGTATADLLLTGASYSSVPIVFEYSQTTGFPYSTSTHSYGAAVALTAADIDSNSGLSWPPSGSRFWFRP